MTYKDAAIHSADIYLKFLKDNNRGVSEYAVTSITEDSTERLFVLHLDGKIRSVDSVKIRIDNQEYEQAQIKPVEYDERQRILKVHPRDDFRKLFSGLSPKDIVVISDLRFLVERVRDWYKRYGDMLSLPDAVPPIPIPEFSELNQQPSDEQAAAVKGALSEPLSYIWGAPGTGKTQFVLARCVLACIKAGKRIIIAAPTNNAIEQVLYGVLSVLEEADVSVDNVLRLGVPSREFYERYPSVCEDSASAKILAETNRQILALENEIKGYREAYDLLPLLNKFLTFEQSFFQLEDKLPALLDELDHYASELSDATNRFRSYESRRSAVHEKLVSAKDEQRHTSVDIAYFSARVNKFSGFLGMLFPGKLEEYTNQLKVITEYSNHLSVRISELEIEFESFALEFQHLSSSVKEAEENVDRCILKIDSLLSFFSRGGSIEQYRRLGVKAYQTKVILELNSSREHYREYLSKYDCLRDTDFAKLSTQIKAAEDEKARLISERGRIENSGVGDRLKTTLVLASTVDTLIGRIRPDDGFMVPSHIFLDEAGYCPLIKASTLFAYGCPVTLFGDHMQLPPICEMDDSKIKYGQNQPVALWSQSSLYSEDIFSKEPELIFADYLENRPAAFSETVQFNLTHTYRFGEGLASILSDFVYPSGFHGSNENNTIIQYIHAPKIESLKHGEQPKRTSCSEQYAICEYVKSHPDEDIGILTPYNLQKSNLRELLRTSGERWSDHVLTVHGSQGREWDTVLLSVVDTIDMWFTDSTQKKSRGLQVINTAVSRAKKKLIIVCDAAYWEVKTNQLIGKLLEVGTRISVSDNLESRC